jgi:hypothetical protein
MQSRTIDISRQLVADHHAALLATAARGRLRRRFSRADRPATSLDLAALERADRPAPAVVLRRAAVDAPDTDRVHKVA